MNKLEQTVTRMNTQYRRQKKALILKIDVPMKVTNKGLIASLSTVDYEGVIAPNGRGIAFDAKECGSTTSFPLSNIKQHQLEYLKFFELMGGISFFLIHFYTVEKEKAYKTPIKFITKHWDDARNNNGRKSIKYGEFDKDWLVDLPDYLGLL